MQNEIIALHKTLKECILTDSQRVAIRNEIGELEDQISLLEFQDQPDIDWGYHDQYDSWHKSLIIKHFRGPGCRKLLIYKGLCKYRNN